MTGKVFNIQRFCTQDGRGIRTTVFLKGCPLRCEWCHNPESQRWKSELAYSLEKCVNCLYCVNACPNGCHSVIDGKHVFNGNNCIGCAKCISPTCSALEMFGYEISADDVLAEVMKDKLFYDNSGGGITLSGGEPLLQADFCMELMKKSKEKGLHVCIETCGHAPKDVILKSAEWVDEYLFDYKLSDPDKHKKYTGVDNTLILENLKLLDTLGKSIVLRCPIIPTVNDDGEHYLKIAELGNTYQSISEIVIEPYHNFGISKYIRLGREYTLSEVNQPETEEIEKIINFIQSRTNVKTLKA